MYQKKPIADLHLGYIFFVFISKKRHFPHVSQAHKRALKGRNFPYTLSVYVL